MNNLSPSVTYNKRFGYIAFGLLLLVILFSTYLHHFQPEVLRVPSNTDVSTWHNPAFEQTLIYNRMSEAEKQKIRTEGVIDGNNLSVVLFNDVVMILLGLICYLHARRHFGFWMASCFLIGSFVFTGLEESLWILVGRFLGGSITNPIGEVAFGSYWFTKGGLWFIETPVVACIGWFFIAYTCVLTAGKVFPKMNLLGRATAGGLIAMGIDLWMDPIATSPEIMSWVWGKGDFLLIFGIPLYNFMGWFLLIFLFAILWEKLPQMEKTWGRAKATSRFLLICVGGAFCVMTFLFLWLMIVGNLLSLMGIKQAIQIPLGW
ncbi:MAG: carotenoid biosynthesis protein [Deltaproteobacteria bacterium]|nr:carotenoid biosynthesis protein [Deltaproteobacteria bacterium]